MGNREGGGFHNQVIPTSPWKSGNNPIQAWLKDFTNILKTNILK